VVCWKECHKGYNRTRCTEYRKQVAQEKEAAKQKIKREKELLNKKRQQKKAAASKKRRRAK
jgi:hypothetical protein